MTLAMLVVIVFSLAAGVGMGYALVFGILNAFDRSRQPLHRVAAQPAGASSGND